MAQPTTFRASELLIEVGDGNSPEVFGAPCGLTAKDFGVTKNLQDTAIPDCDAPDDPDWLGRDPVSLSRDINGSGVLTEEYYETWDDWAVSKDPRNVRVTIGDLQWTGRYHLETFKVSGTDKGRLQVEVALKSDGEVTRALHSD